MYADPTTHPTPDELAAYSNGKLSDADTLVVAQHLETCHDCSKAAENVPPDTFVGIVQSARVATLAPGVMPSQPGTSPGTPSPAAPQAEVDLELPAELANHPRFRIVREL